MASPGNHSQPQLTGSPGPPIKPRAQGGPVRVRAPIRKSVDLIHKRTAGNVRYSDLTSQTVFTAQFPASLTKAAMLASTSSSISRTSLYVPLTQSKRSHCRQPRRFAVRAEEGACRVRPEDNYGCHGSSCVMRSLKLVFNRSCIRPFGCRVKALCAQC